MLYSNNLGINAIQILSSLKLLAQNYCCRKWFISPVWKLWTTKTIIFSRDMIYQLHTILTRFENTSEWIRNPVQHVFLLLWWLHHYFTCKWQLAFAFSYIASVQSPLPCLWNKYTVEKCPHINIWLFIIIKL